MSRSGGQITNQNNKSVLAPHAVEKLQHTRVLFLPFPCVWHSIISPCLPLFTPVLRRSLMYAELTRQRTPQAVAHLCDEASSLLSCTRVKVPRTSTWDQTPCTSMCCNNPGRSNTSSRCSPTCGDWLHGSWSLLFTRPKTPVPGTLPSRWLPLRRGSCHPCL